MRAKAITGVACVTFIAMLASVPAYAKPDWNAVGHALGKPGTELADDVYRVALPRPDLKVTLDGVAIKPALALGGLARLSGRG